jgi:MFS family permease
MAGNLGVASAMMADITTAENRAKGMGMIGAAFGLGMTIGPGMGGILSGKEANIMLPALVAAGLSFAAIIAGKVFLQESLSAEKRRDNARHRQDNPISVLKMIEQTGNRLLVFQYFLLNSCLGLLTVIFPIWTGALLGWTPVEVGTTLVVQGLILAIMQGAMVAPMAKRYGELRFLMVAVVILAIGCLLASQASSVPTVVLSFFVSMTGATLCLPLINSITTKRTPLQYRGRMLGTTSSVGALGRVFGPASGALMVELFGFDMAWIFAGTMALLFSLWVAGQLRRFGSFVEDIDAGPQAITKS